jgi:hypothetical protein
MPSNRAFGIKSLRDAVAQRVKETSIRAVAEEIGMSPSGLHVFLRGSAPHPGTRAKLVEWYLGRRGADTSTHGVSKADVDAAVRVLVHYVNDGVRTEARARRANDILQRLEMELASEVQ